MPLRVFNGSERAMKALGQRELAFNESWGLYYKTLRIMEKEKIYGSIFSSNISP